MVQLWMIILMWSKCSQQYTNIANIFWNGIGNCEYIIKHWIAPVDFHSNVDHITVRTNGLVRQTVSVKHVIALFTPFLLIRTFSMAQPTEFIPIFLQRTIIHFSSSLFLNIPNILTYFVSFYIQTTMFNHKMWLTNQNMIRSHDIMNDVVKIWSFQDKCVNH